MFNYTYGDSSPLTSEQLRDLQKKEKEKQVIDDMKKSKNFDQESFDYMNMRSVL